MPDMTQELFQTIRRIQIQTAHLAEDLLAGAYRSAFKGKGMEFEEVREYQAGDDVRDIDWKVTARMNDPYVKVFREERELTVMLMVDVSSSAYFGGKNGPKSSLIAEIGALIAFSAIKNHDKVGLLLFSDMVEKYIPPRNGVRNVLRVIRELLAFKPSHRGTNFSEAFTFMGNVQKRSGICFLISDFLAEDPRHALALLALKQDLISISVTDPYEMSFPRMGLIELIDLETHETMLVDSSDPGVQEKFKQSAEKRRKLHRSLMNKIGAGHIEIRTDQPYLPPIQKFFKIRGNKRR